MDFHVAGAFEFFEDDFIHARTGIDQRRGDNRQRAAFFDIARRAEEAFRFVQRVGIHTAGKNFAGVRLNGVVGASETGDGVEQDDDVAFVLDHALGFFDDHFGDLHMPLGRFIEGGTDHFGAAAGALHVGDFFRALVDEQDEQIRLGIVLQNRVGELLHQHGFAGARRRDDQAARAFADRANQVEHARGKFIRGGFQNEPLVRETAA